MSTEKITFSGDLHTALRKIKHCFHYDLNARNKHKGHNVGLQWSNVLFANKLLPCAVRETESSASSAEDPCRQRLKCSLMGAPCCQSHADRLGSYYNVKEGRGE